MATDKQTNKQTESATEVTEAFALYIGKILRKSLEPLWSNGKLDGLSICLLLVTNFMIQLSISPRLTYPFNVIVCTHARSIFSPEPIAKTIILSCLQWTKYFIRPKDQQNLTKIINMKSARSSCRLSCSSVAAWPRADGPGRLQWSEGTWNPEILALLAEKWANTKIF